MSGHFPKLQVPVSMFNRAYIEFRDIMQDKRNAIDLVDDAYQNLVTVYASVTATQRHKDTTGDQISSIAITMRAIAEEWTSRRTILRQLLAA